MKKKSFEIIAVISFILSSCFLPAYSQLMQPSNLDFEDGIPGKMPRSWILPSYAESRLYNAALTEYQPKSGKYCLELNRFAAYKDSNYGSVMQSIDAKPYRGKTIKFGAWVKAEITGPKGSAHLWLIEYDSNHNIVLYDLMEERPIVMNTWNYFEIIEDITDDANYINFGLMLKGNGKAWIDNASFEIVELSTDDYAPPKTLNDRNITNLLAFSKLYGLAKHFYPSSESSKIDDDKFILSSIKKIETVENDEVLIETLNNIFKPYYPGIKIFKKNSPPREYYYKKKPADAADKAAVSWLHIGAPTMQQTTLTYSRRVNIYQSLRNNEGAVIQLINIEGFEGQEITLSIDAKAETIGASGRAEIRMGVEDKNETKDFIMQHLAVAEVKGNKWKNYRLKLLIPENSFALRIGLVLSGEGYVRFDNAELLKSNNKKLDLRNKDFEEDPPGKPARGWRIIKVSEQAGYSANIITNDKTKGKKSLEIRSDKATRIPLPKAGEFFQGDLSETIAFSLPVCLYIDKEGKTLPHSTEQSAPIDNNMSLKPGGKDRFSRLTVFIQAWNNFKLFNLFKKDENYWDDAFRELISKAALDKNDHEFIKTLEALTALLDDSNARVWKKNTNFYSSLPFLMKWTEGSLLITKVHPSFDKIREGDIITEINGKPTYEYLRDEIKYISAANEERAILKAVALLRSGIESSSVKMTFVSRDGYNQQLTVQRSIFLNELIEERLPFVAELNPDIFYVDLTSVDDKTFYTLVDTLKRAKGIIFDLRGTTKISEHFLSFFLTKPIKSVEWKIPVYTKPSPAPITYKTIQADIKARNILAGKKIVFLEDERTIAYSEAILTLVKENSLGEIIGKSSAGTAGEISAFRIGANYGFAWTGVKAVDKKGVDIYGEGVTPTISIKELQNSNDDLLRIAYEIIK